MKHLRFLVLISSFSILFFSCQKELSVENGNAGNSSSQWEFSEAANFKGDIDTAYLEPSGGFQSLVFEGTTPDGKGEIFMQLFGTTLTATVYKNPNVFFEYSQNDTLIYSNVPSSIDKFTVIITTLDSTSVTGTFSGEVVNAAGEIKTITNGKFTAALKKSTAPPLQGICKIQKIDFLDSATGTGFASLSNLFNSSNLITKTQFNSSNALIQEFNFIYTTNKIAIDTAQYFDIDANGRILSFNGHLDADPAQFKVKVNYSFDNSGYMTKALYSLQSAPTLTIYELTFTWTNGNLTKTVITTPGNLQKIEQEYQYDLTKSPKGFMCFFPNSEVFLTQAAINYGKNSTNAITKSTYKMYDAIGNLTLQSEAIYTGYTYNAQNYVTAFNVTGDGSILNGSTKYALTYKCY